MWYEGFPWSRIRGKELGKAALFSRNVVPKRSKGEALCDAESSPKRGGVGKKKKCAGWGGGGSTRGNLGNPSQSVMTCLLGGKGLKEISDCGERRKKVKASLV